MLSKRVVSQITEYLEPKEIFRLITQREWQYTSNQKRYGTRDRAIMSGCFCTGGRISAVVGGDRMKWNKEKRRSVRTGEKHEGLKWKNISFKKKGYILIKGMRVVKRSKRVLKKYGAQAGVRDDFIIPLKRGLFDNPYHDQLVPFGWLLMEYLKLLGKTKTEGRIFEIERKRAWRIIRYVTGMYPNWFRAQCEHFRGHYIEKDSVMLSKFMKVVKTDSVSHYIGYAWQDQLKDIGMDFDWIERATEKIVHRIKEAA